MLWLSSSWLERSAKIRINFTDLDLVKEYQAAQHFEKLNHCYQEKWVDRD